MSARKAPPRGTLELFRDDRQEMIRPEVIEDLTEAEREEVFLQVLDEAGSAKDRAVKAMYAKWGSLARKGRDCPMIFATICRRLGENPDLTRRRLWDQIATEDALKVYVGEDGRMHEDGAKSLSRRSFERYYTLAREHLSE